MDKITDLDKFQNDLEKLEKKDYDISNITVW